MSEDLDVKDAKRRKGRQENSLRALRFFACFASYLSQKGGGSIPNDLKYTYPCAR